MAQMQASCPRHEASYVLRLLGNTDSWLAGQTKLDLYTRRQERLRYLKLPI